MRPTPETDGRAGRNRNAGRVERGTVRTISAVVVGAGLVSVITGTFAPWLVSGSVRRNSYAIAGIVGRLGLAGDGFGPVALTWWPWIGPIAAVVLVAGVLRWWRTYAAMAIVLGILTGIIGGGVLAVTGGVSTMGIGLVRTGPTVVLIGAVTTVLGAIVLLLADARSRPRMVTMQSR